jgi:hypothetical protein
MCIRKTSSLGHHQQTASGGEALDLRKRRGPAEGRDTRGVVAGSRDVDMPHVDAYAMPLLLKASTLGFASLAQAAVSRLGVPFRSIILKGARGCVNSPCEK